MNTNNHIPPTAVERAAQARQQQMQQEREQRWLQHQPDLEPPPRWDGGMLMLGTVLTLCAVVYGTLFLIWIL